MEITRVVRQPSSFMVMLNGGEDLVYIMDDVIWAETLREGIDRLPKERKKELVDFVKSKCEEIHHYPFIDMTKRTQRKVRNRTCGFCASCTLCRMYPVDRETAKYELSLYGDRISPLATQKEKTKEYYWRARGKRLKKQFFYDLYTTIKENHGEERYG